MQQATPPKKIRNHAALWTLALFVGAAVMALWFLIHASYEHSPGYPRGLRRFINRNEVLFLFGGAMLIMGLVAFIGYKRDWFARLPLQARLDLAAINAALDQAGMHTFGVALAHEKRLCHGLVTLTPGEVMFRCLHDEGMAAAAAGSAVAGQFGLIGGLIGGAAAGVRSHARDKEIAAARAATDPLPLDQQLAFNAHSFRLGAHQVGGLRTRMGARLLVTPKGDYIFNQIGEHDFAALIAWLTRRGVAIESM
jgi:hypothetical protein